MKVSLRKQIRTIVFNWLTQHRHDSLCNLDRIGLPENTALHEMVISSSHPPSSSVYLAFATMCRWFAYLSPTEPCLLEDVLINPKNSLCHQVHEHFLPGLVPHHPANLVDDPAHLWSARNSINNIDGCGVAWYTSSNADFEPDNSDQSSDGRVKEGLRPAAYKTVVPPINDINFRSICANTETRVCFAHIRATSATPIVHVNNHPFIFGRHCFMHNGTIADFTAIKRAVTAKLSDAAHACVLGGTDSEHLGALYMTFLTKNGDADSFERVYSAMEMASALHNAVATVIEIQQQILGTNMEPNSLNLCTTDGIKLIAYRFRNHATQQPPSLYWSETAGTTLNRKYPDNPDGRAAEKSFTKKLRTADMHGKHVIVASEPSTYKEAEWHLIGRNQVLIAEPGKHVDVKDIPYDQDWNAEEKPNKAQ